VADRFEGLQSLQGHLLVGWLQLLALPGSAAVELAAAVAAVLVGDHCH
jgi:hypothetical protein